MTGEARSRVPLIVAAIAAIGVLGVGGYFLQGKLKCDGLRDDFLNHASSMRTYGEAASFLDSAGEASKNVASLRDRSTREMERSYLGLSRECGDRVAGNAMREARDLVSR